MNLEQRVALITGASEGIGLATARLFASRGARLALVARSADALERLASELPDAIAIPADLRQEGAPQLAVERAIAHFGRLDILINNAAQGLHTPLEQTNLDHLRAIFELNVVSVLATMQAAIPQMRRQPDGGVIVNISSGTSKVVIPGVGPYAATKSALNQLTLTARQELAADDIRVCLVYPFITVTAFHQHLANLAAGDAEWTPRAGRPGGRAPDSAETVAEAIAQAVSGEDAEVYVESVRALMQPS